MIEEMEAERGGGSGGSSQLLGALDGVKALILERGLALFLGRGDEMNEDE